MRIRLKTKLVLAISGLVMALVAALSTIYVSQIVRQRINSDLQTGRLVGQEIERSAEHAVEAAARQSPTPLDRDGVAASLQADSQLNSVMNYELGDAPIIFDAAVVGGDGTVLFGSDPTTFGKPLGQREDFQAIAASSFWRQLRWIYGKPRISEVRVTPARAAMPFSGVRVGIVTVFLKSEVQPQLRRAMWFSIIAVLVSLVLAAALSNLALQPLEAVSRRLDALAAAHIGEAVAREPAAKGDEVRIVTSKIDRLGREIRDVKEVFSELKENLDQIMGNLQDGLMLFTRDWRAVLVSASAESFLGKNRGEVLGSAVHSIFTEQSALGRLVLQHVASHQAVSGYEVETENRRRVQVSLDFIEEHGERIGALLTMRDAESVRQIENEIELSRRLAAIGRLTSGVAHEVKNPINAIVVHLEILRQKLQTAEPDVRRHMDVIGTEIQRLDRVVQMLVDFTRPVELRLADMDLRRVLEEVVVLSTPDAARHNVKLTPDFGDAPLLVKIDVDLVKQAVLNVVLNGVQAMPTGGTLGLRASHDERGDVQLDIADSGGGIPLNIRDKIFDLYFTTKKSGSGIGLAMTFRVMQLHNGSVDFDTSTKGTTFHLHFPALEAHEPGTEAAATRVSA